MRECEKEMLARADMDALRAVVMKQIERKGRTIQEVADKAGLSRGTVSGFLHGRATSDKSIDKIVHAVYPDLLGLLCLLESFHNDVDKITNDVLFISEEMDSSPEMFKKVAETLQYIHDHPGASLEVMLAKFC